MQSILERTRCEYKSRVGKKISGKKIKIFEIELNSIVLQPTR